MYKDYNALKSNPETFYFRKICNSSKSFLNKSCKEIKNDKDPSSTCNNFLIANKKNSNFSNGSNSLFSIYKQNKKISHNESDKRLKENLYQIKAFLIKNINHQNNQEYNLSHQKDSKRSSYISPIKTCNDEFNKYKIINKNINNISSTNISNITNNQNNVHNINNLLIRNLTEKIINLSNISHINSIKNGSESFRKNYSNIKINTNDKQSNCSESKEKENLNNNKDDSYIEKNENNNKVTVKEKKVNKIKIRNENKVLEEDLNILSESKLDNNSYLNNHKANNYKYNKKNYVVSRNNDAQVNLFEQRMMRNYSMKKSLMKRGNLLNVFPKNNECIFDDDSYISNLLSRCSNRGNYYNNNFANSTNNSIINGKYTNIFNYKPNTNSDNQKKAIKKRLIEVKKKYINSKNQENIRSKSTFKNEKNFSPGSNSTNYTFRDCGEGNATNRENNLNKNNIFVNNINNINKNMVRNDNLLNGNIDRTRVFNEIKLLINKKIV